MTAQRPLLGIALVVLAVSCFASMDSTIRYLGGLLPVLLILWARYSFQAVSMALWLSWQALRGRPAFQVGTADLVVEIQQHFGDAGHAGAADADEVHALHAAHGLVHQAARLREIGFSHAPPPL